MTEFETSKEHRVGRTEHALSCACSELLSLAMDPEGKKLIDIRDIYNAQLLLAAVAEAILPKKQAA